APRARRRDARRGGTAAADRRAAAPAPAAPAIRPARSCFSSQCAPSRRSIHRRLPPELSRDRPRGSRSFKLVALVQRLSVADHDLLPLAVELRLLALALHEDEAQHFLPPRKRARLARAAVHQDRRGPAR